MEPLVIHQAVHGYNGGHQLLASSVTLPPASARLMLILSDMSGPTIQPGFETYLTGYPLPDYPAWVLARTWYADDMTRPGCVWTHSLIVAHSDLPSISHLNELEALFERPGPSTRGTLNPLSFDTRRVPAELRAPEIRHTLAALYGEPARPTVVLGERSHGFDAAALAIISQQWPRLRRTFGFCTGSLSARVGSGVVFDLHHVPRALWSTVRRDLADAVVVEASAPATGDDAPWLVHALADLQLPGDLRGFLWGHGADAVGGRTDFRALVEVHLAAKQYEVDHDAAALVARVGAALPSSSTAGRRLKAELLAVGPLGLAPSGADRSGLWRAVATTPEYAAFEDALAPDAFAETLWREARDLAIDTLLDLTGVRLNPLGDRLVTALAAHTDVEAALALTARRPGILPALVATNASLASQPEVWKAAAGRRREILDVLLEPSATDHLERALPAILRARADELASPLADALGDRVVAGILDALDGNEQPIELGDAWQQVLIWRPRVVIEWLTSHDARPRTATFAVGALDSESSLVTTTPAALWIRVAGALEEGLEPPERIQLAGFLLAIGFGRRGDDGATLIARTFDIVHEAAASGHLRYETGRLLRKFAPPVWPWRDWDWCERLVTALVKGCVGGDWDPVTLLAAARSERAFRQVMEVGSSFSNRATLRRLRKAVRSRRADATPLQSRLMEDTYLG